MLHKVLFAIFIVSYGLWLLVHPAHTQSRHWKDCWTPKGIVCVPTKQ
jgi:hypothetical protein